jgi:carnosine N-methyltransferase
LFWQLAGNFRRRKDHYSLPLADQGLLNRLGYKQKLADVDKAIKANAEFIDQIIENPDIFRPDLYGDNTIEADQVPPDSRAEALKAEDGSGNVAVFSTRRLE